MGGDGIPEDDTVFDAQLLEQAVDDGARGLAPAARSIGTGRTVGGTPAGEVAFTGEGDPRPAHSLVAGGFANCQDVGVLPLVEVVSKVFQANGGGIRNVLRT